MEVGARRSGPGRKRASVGLARTENGRRLSEVAAAAGGYCAEGGKEEEDCGRGPGLEF